MSLRIDRTLIAMGPSGTIDHAANVPLSIDGDRAAPAQFFAVFDQPHLAAAFAS